MEKLLGSLPTIVATTNIHIYPHVNRKASIVLVHGPVSDGDQETIYKGNNEGLLIAALREARAKFPEAQVLWIGWEGYSYRAFMNLPVCNLCLNATEICHYEGDSGLPVHELIVR